MPFKIPKKKFDEYLIYKKYKKYEKMYHENIKERLCKSIYPNQMNDFFFLTIPKGHPNEGREITVDYKLINIIVYFWNNDFITCGWVFRILILANESKAEYLIHGMKNTLFPKT